MATRPILYEKVLQYVTAEIQSGHYKPGDMIPTEKELMAQFGVSRMTTNRALQMLVSSGLITRKAGLGSFVTNALGEPGASSLDEDAAAEPEELADPAMPLIGFVIPFIDQTIGPRLLAEIELQLRANGFALALACSYGEQTKEEAAIEQLLSIGAQGLIVFPVNGQFYNPAILRLHVNDFPLVLVDKQLQGIPLPYVVTDNTGGARKLTEHLLELGHRKIAFFSPPWEGTSSLSERLTGYQQALDAQGLAVSAECLLSTVPYRDDLSDFEAVQVETIERFLCDHEDVTAVLAADDQLARYWLIALHRLRLRVPRDFSVVCFDGSPPSAVAWTVTCAMQDQINMARHAVRMVIDLLTGEAQSHIGGVTLPAEFCLGSSSGPLPAEMRPRKTPSCPVLLTN